MSLSQKLKLILPVAKIQMETINADSPHFSRLEFIISKVVQNLHPFCFRLREFHLVFFSSICSISYFTVNDMHWSVATVYLQLDLTYLKQKWLQDQVAYDLTELKLILSVWKWTLAFRNMVTSFMFVQPYDNLRNSVEKKHTKKENNKKPHSTLKFPCRLFNLNKRKCHFCVKSWCFICFDS